MATSKSYYSGHQGPVNNLDSANNITNNVTYSTSVPAEQDPISFDVKSTESNFVGRSAMLHSIKDALEKSLDSANATSNIIIAIVGLGGIGKTQLVRKCIQENRALYKHVIWINSEKSESINESFKRLASNELNISLTNSNGEVKGPNDIIVQVLNKLSKSQTLCIYDNVDKIETIKFVLTVEPSGSKPHIIITTRIQEWGVGISVMHLNVWDVDEAHEYVSKTLDDPIDSNNDKNLLVEKLQRFPLALRQATAYINYQRKVLNFKIADYLQNYDTSYEGTKEMLGSEIFKEDAYNIYEKTTLTTWRITIDAIKGCGAKGALACRILNMIAYFDPENIHRDIFIHLIDTSENQQAAKQPKIDFEAKIISAVRLLVNYSMVDSIDRQSVLSIHSFDNLVQEFSELPTKILKTLLRLGNDNRAKAFGNEILPSLKRILGADHPDTLITSANLAKSYGKVGNHSDGIQLFEKVLQKQKLILGADHSDTLTASHNLAHLYGRVGKYSAAIQMFEETLEKRKNILGEDHPDTLTTIHSLADSLRNSGKDTDAIKMFEEVLERQKFILGDDHKDTLSSRRKLAVLYRNIGKHSVAIQMFEDILQKRRNILGADHLDTLKIRSTLASSYSKVGKHLIAIQMLEENLDKRKNIQGDDHRDTIATRQNLAQIYGKVGKHTVAIQMFQEALDASRNTLGDEHPDTLTTRCNLASSYVKIGEHSIAIHMFEDILTKFNKVLGADHTRTLYTRSNLASLHAELGNYLEAIQMFEEILEKQKSTLGADHPNTLTVRNNLANSYCKMGNHSVAIQLFQEILEKRDNILGADHPDTLITKFNLASSFVEIGKHSDAIQMFEEVLEKQEAILGGEHPDTLLTRHKLDVQRKQ